MSGLPHLDPLFHQPFRTRLTVLLYRGELSFVALKSSLDCTDGNLDAHLRKLSNSGHLHSRMVTEGRPHTLYELSNSGRLAFDEYLGALQDLLAVANSARISIVGEKNGEGG